MAQTKRKRRTKHRGNAAGIVEARGKTHKGATGSTSAGKNVSNKELARQRRVERMNRPPTWSSAIQRAAIAAVLFVVLLILAFKRPVGEGLALGAFVMVFYVPLGYFTDLSLYRYRQRRQARDGS